MNKEKKNSVTLVMPVYNTNETILNQCVGSIIRQTSEQWHLLIVDDGSTSKVADICEKFTVDNRISVVHIPNSGVSVARNYGTSMVADPYIMYVDSDDVLSEFAVEDALDIIDKNDADIVYGKVCIIPTQRDMEEHLSFHPEWCDNNICSKNDILYVMFGGITDERNNIRSIGQIIRAPFARIIKTEIAKQILFPVDYKIGEDIIWNSRLLSACSTIAVANSIWYGYVQYTCSAINKYYGDRAEVAEKWFNIILCENSIFFQEHPENEGQMLATEYYAIICYDILPSPKLGSMKEKNKIAKQIIGRYPWNVLNENPYRQTLSILQKFTVLLGKCGLGALAVAIYIRIKPYFKRII